MIWNEIILAPVILKAQKWQTSYPGKRLFNYIEDDFLFKL